MSPEVRRHRIYDMCVFAVLATIMFCSKVVMEFLPNIHLLGMLTIVYTLVYRFRALIPIYLYVFLNGLYAGFNLWWAPYLYLWTILWGVTMLLPRRLPQKKWSVAVYSVVCALHGLAFGTLYAPAQALFYGLNFQAMIAWIVAGLPFDVIHMIGNFVAGLLVLPMYKVLSKIAKRAEPS